MDFFCVQRICSFLTLFFFDFTTSSDGVVQSPPFFFWVLPSLGSCTGLWQCDIVPTSSCQRELHILLHFDFVSNLFLWLYRLLYAANYCDHDCDSLPKCECHPFGKYQSLFVFVWVIWQRSTLFPWHHNCLAA